jgi:hypothetical protein
VVAIRARTEGRLARLSASLEAPGADLAALEPLFPAAERLSGRAALAFRATADLRAMRAGGAPAIAHVSGSGTISAPALEVGPVEARRVEVKLALDHGRLTVETRDLTISGGRASLRASADLLAALPAVDASLSLAGFVPTAPLLRVAGYASPVFVFAEGPGAVKGLLSLEATLSGRGSDAKTLLETLKGGGSIAIAQGTIAAGGLVRSLRAASGGALALPDTLEIAKFEQAFTIKAGRILNPGLSLALGPDMRLQIAGATGLDGKLDQNLVLAGPAKLLGGAVKGELGQVLARAAEPLLRFHLGGTVRSPALGPPAVSDAARGVEEGILKSGVERGREELEKKGVKIPEIPGLPGAERAPAQQRRQQGQEEAPPPGEQQAPAPPDQRPGRDQEPPQRPPLPPPENPLGIPGPLEWPPKEGGGIWKER